MSNETALAQGVNLNISAPPAARFVFFNNGEKVFEAADSTEIIFQAKVEETYRAEVYLDRLGSPFDRMP